MNEYNYGFIIHEGVVITITEEAQLREIDGLMYYVAMGIDDEGNAYPLRWEC